MSPAGSPSRPVSIVTRAAVMAPVIVVVTSLAALHTALRGEPIGGWGMAYAAVAFVGIAASLAVGPRLLPGWFEHGWFLLVVAVGVALTVSEWLAPATLALGVGLAVMVRRAPRRVVPLPPPQPFERADGPGPTWPAVSTPPLPSLPAPGVTVAPPGPPAVAQTTVVLVPPWARPAFLATGLVCLGGGAAMVAMAWGYPICRRRPGSSSPPARCSPSVSARRCSGSPSPCSAPGT